MVVDIDTQLLLFSLKTTKLENVMKSEALKIVDSLSINILFFFFKSIKKILIKKSNQVFNIFS